MHRVWKSPAALFVLSFSVAVLSPGTADGEGLPPHVAKGDSDHDGRSDLVVLHTHVHQDDCEPSNSDAVRRHYNGHVVWGHSGGPMDLTLQNILEFSSTVWQIAATGDFNGDGVPDLFWEKLDDGDEAPALAPHRIDAKVVLTRDRYAAPDDDEPGDGAPTAEWAVVGTSDFGGIDLESGALTPPDGMSDLLLHNTLTATLGIWISDGETFQKENRFILPGPAGDAEPVAVGDLDGDTLPEIVFADAAGRLSYWKMAGAVAVETGDLTPNQVLNSDSWKITGSGDFNGDGTDDLVFWNKGTPRVAVWFMGQGDAGSGPTRITGGLVTFIGDHAPKPPTPCDEYRIVGPR